MKRKNMIMKTRIMALTAFLFVLSSGVAFAQDGAPAPSTEPAVAPAPAEEAVADIPKEEIPVTSEDKKEEAKEESLVDQAKDAKEAYDKVQTASPAEKKFAIAGLIAVILNLLLTGLKKVMKLTKSKKKWLPYVALGLGVVIAVVERYALGGGWGDAILYGGAGPGAVVVQELMKAWAKEDDSEPAAA